MKHGTCRACRQPIEAPPIGAPAPRPVTVKLIVRASDLGRTGEFELCSRCVGFPEIEQLADQVRAALMAELQALLA
jgi:hypothetical protein